jgi:DNA repair exonuclease SbcCD ATPase subunit
VQKRVFFESLGDIIIRDEVNFANAERDNGIKDRIDKELIISTNNLKRIQTYIKLFNLVNKCVVAYSAKYKKVRIDQLEQEITANLHYLFPDDNYEACFDFDQARGKEIADLVMLQNKVAYDIELGMGGFVQQLVSVVALYKINKLRGSKFMVLDESLSSADKTNLTLLTPLLDRMIEEGMQIVVVEHKDELYLNVTRKVIKVSRNKSNNAFIVVKEEIIDV